MTSLISIKLCLCREQSEINQANTEKKNKKEAQRQKEQEKKEQMEQQKKESLLKKNFQVNFVLQETLPPYREEMVFVIPQFISLNIWNFAVLS